MLLLHLRQKNGNINEPLNLEEEKIHGVQPIDIEQQSVGKYAALKHEVLVSEALAV